MGSNSISSTKIRSSSEKSFPSGFIKENANFSCYHHSERPSGPHCKTLFDIELFFKSFSQSYTSAASGLFKTVEPSSS